jgi:hypothetical protein
VKTFNALSPEDLQIKPSCLFLLSWLRWPPSLTRHTLSNVNRMHIHVSICCSSITKSLKALEGKATTCWNRHLSCHFHVVDGTDTKKRNIRVLSVQLFAQTLHPPHKLKLFQMDALLVQLVLVSRCSNTSAQIFQKKKEKLRILGARRVTRSKFHTECPQILRATVQNLVARITWCVGFVLPWLTVQLRLESSWLNTFRIIYSSKHLAILRLPTVHKTRISHFQQAPTGRAITQVKERN